MRNRLFLGVMVCWMLASCGGKENPQPDDGGQGNGSDPYFQIVNNAYRPYMGQAQSVGLSVGIYIDGETYFYNYGEIKKGAAKVPNENTVYEIGSVSKIYAALLAVSFFKDKGITEEEKIARYLPNSIPVLERGDKEVTFKDLLTHTAGFPREPQNYSGTRGSYDSTKLYLALQNLTLNSTPGASYSYSNFGFATLSTILERNWDIRYGIKVQEIIAGPLGLQRTKTRLSEYDDYNQSNTNIATGYNNTGNPVAYRDPNETGAFKGSGAINSTIKDLLVFGRYQIETANSPIGELSTWIQQPAFQSGSVRRGLGWSIATVGGLECLVHDGATSGFNASFLVSKSNKIVIAVLANNAGTNIHSRMLQMAPLVFSKAAQ